MSGGYLYRDCPAMWGENPDGRCVGCGETLTGRRRVWCSEWCCNAWRKNHVWQVAREAAVKRAGRRCQRCGITGGWKWRHGLRGDVALEVNHLEPIRGRHAEVSCLHHQEGLEVLCHECHVDTTNRQFQRGKYRVPQDLGPTLWEAS